MIEIGKGSKDGERKAFPENPQQGDHVSRIVKGREVTFEATGKTGFGKWKIISNKPTSESSGERY